MARESFEPTFEDRVTVKILSAFGMEHAEICKHVKNPGKIDKATGKPLRTPRPISVVTLRRKFRAELDAGLNHAKDLNASVAASLYMKALGSGPAAVTACIFWLKTRAGWTEAEPEGQSSAVTPQAMREIAEVMRTRT